jgi:hypothetical protein
MAKAKQTDRGSGEKKLRKKLQRAEEAHIKAQQQLEAAQDQLRKAEGRAARRATALEAVRAELTVLAAATTAPEARPEASLLAEASPSLTEEPVPPAEGTDPTTSEAVTLLSPTEDQPTTAPRPPRARRAVKAPTEAPSSSQIIPPGSATAAGATADEASSSPEADAPLGLIVP